MSDAVFMDSPARTEDAVIPHEVGLVTAKGINEATKGQLHSRLWSIFLAEMERQRTNRLEMATDERFADGDQWTELEAELMKYLADVNRSEFAWSQAFEDAVCAGVGWIESGVQGDEQGEPIYTRRENWRNMLHDSAAQEYDIEDGRYIFRFKYTDVDTAVSHFEDAREVIETAAEATIDIASLTMDDPSEAHENYLTGQYEGSRQIEFINRNRVRMVEGWLKLPVKEKRISGGDFRGEIYDPYSQGHLADINEGRAQVVERVTQRVFVVIFTSQGIVWHSPSPYRHNRYPFTPIWCYRNKETLLPYGIVRNMRDLQRDVNKRHAHALFLLVHKRVIMDQNAIEDIDNLEQEINRPNAIIEKRPGYEFKVESDRDIGAAHMELMSRSIQFIQHTTGVTDESLGRETNAKSGKAIIARQEQGALATAPLFDNLRLSRQIAGEKELSLIEQFMTEEKQFRITNKRGTPQYVTINDGLPQNDIVRHKADFIISESAWQATLRRADSLELTEFFKMVGPAAPQVVLATLDLVVESMDVPNGEEIVTRIRQITGMEDPDTDPDDPEAMARQEQKMKEAKLQEDMVLAQLRKAQADADDKSASADKKRADIEKLFAGLPGDKITQKNMALELAMQLINLAAAAPVADEILAESGYVPPPAAEPSVMPQGADIPPPEALPVPEEAIGQEPVALTEPVQPMGA